MTFNRRIRRRNQTSERRDWYVLVHRMRDDRSVARCVSDGIKVAVGNPLLGDMVRIIY